MNQKTHQENNPKMLDTEIYWHPYQQAKIHENQLKFIESSFWNQMNNPREKKKPQTTQQQNKTKKP